MEPSYGEVTGEDFQEAMETVVRAEQAFRNLPSKIRKEFQNDPAQFLDFVHDPENQDRMVEMGLAEYTPEEIRTRKEAAQAQKIKDEKIVENAKNLQIELKEDKD